MSLADDVRSRARDRVVAEVARGIVDLVDQRQRVRLGVDGRDGAGKTCFAHELAAALSDVVHVVRATIDHFHRPAAARYARGRTSPEGFYLDSYDLRAFRALLLDPAARTGDGEVVLGIWDVERDAPRPRRRARLGPRAVLIVDGIFLHRPELRDAWDATVYLDVDHELGLARCAARGDGVAELDDPRNRRYVVGQELYHEACAPADAATWVIDNRDLATPTIVASRI